MFVLEAHGVGGQVVLDNLAAYTSEGRADLTERRAPRVALRAMLLASKVTGTPREAEARMRKAVMLVMGDFIRTSVSTTSPRGAIIGSRPLQCKHSIWA